MHFHGVFARKCLKINIFIKINAMKSKNDKLRWLKNCPFLQKKLIKTKKHILKLKKAIAKSL